MKQKLTTVLGMSQRKIASGHCSQWSCHQRMWPMMSTSIPFYTSSLSASLLQPADEQSEDTSSSTSLWEHPVWRLTVDRYWWSTARCHLGVMMSKCLNTNRLWTRTSGARCMDQTLVILAVNRFVREQDVTQSALKDWPKRTCTFNGLENVKLSSPVKVLVF